MDNAAHVSFGPSTQCQGELMTVNLFQNKEENQTYVEKIIVNKFFEPIIRNPLFYQCFSLIQY